MTQGRKRPTPTLEDHRRFAHKLDVAEESVWTLQQDLHRYGIPYVGARLDKARGKLDAVRSTLDEQVIHDLYGEDRDSTLHVYYGRDATRPDTQPWAAQEQGEDGSIRWNGFTWPRSYQSEALEVVGGPSVASMQMRLSCGHYTRVTDRVCPHCGRIVRELEW